MCEDQQPVAGGPVLFRHDRVESIQQAAGRQCAAEMMMLAGPELAQAQNGPFGFLVQGLAALLDVGGRKIAGVPELLVE